MLAPRQPPATGGSSGSVAVRLWHQPPCQSCAHRLLASSGPANLLCSTTATSQVQQRALARKLHAYCAATCKARRHTLAADACGHSMQHNTVSTLLK